MKKSFLILVSVLIVIQSITGCGSGTDGTMKKYGKEALSVVEDYLDLKIDSDEAFDKLSLIDDKSNSYFTKEDEEYFGGDDTAKKKYDYQTDYDIYWAITLLDADMYGINFHNDSNKDLIEEYEKLKELLDKK